MVIYVVLDDNNYVTAWGSTRSGDYGEVEVDIPEDSVFFVDNPFNYKLVDGELVKDLELKLKKIKDEKDLELNEACRQSILAGFSYTIDGVLYWFSYDMEAQGNFRDAKEVLSDGLVDELQWTVRVGGQDGEYSRIAIDLDTIKALSLVIVQHKAGLISRYRDILMPQVNAAKTVEEVRDIVW